MTALPCLNPLRAQCCCKRTGLIKFLTRSVGKRPRGMLRIPKPLFGWMIIILVSLRVSTPRVAAEQRPTGRPSTWIRARKSLRSKAQILGLLRMTDRCTPLPGALRGPEMDSSLTVKGTPPFKTWTEISGIKATFMA